MIKNILDVCQRSSNIYMCTCVGWFVAVDNSIMHWSSVSHNQVELAV